MRPNFVIDELHARLLVHRGIAKPEILAIRRTLQRGALQKRLEEATRDVIAQFPSMRHVRFTLSS